MTKFIENTPISYIFDKKIENQTNIKVFCLMVAKEERTRPACWFHVTPRRF